jgi:beta-glucosidase
VLRGEYPAEALDRLPLDMRLVHANDLATIAAPSEFLGVNYYQPRVVERTEGGRLHALHQEGHPHTDLGWAVRPDALYDLLLRLRDDYAPPAILVTENGASYSDAPTHDGAVRDPERQA